ncbi:MAG TPA: hypothetical protein DCR55_12360 [Lentisphaeria bacterium]|nr:hypothetical protein [Lentisphaeria bacterium]
MIRWSRQTGRRKYLLPYCVWPWPRASAADGLDGELQPLVGYGAATGDVAGSSAKAAGTVAIAEGALWQVDRGGPFHGPNTRTSSGITPIAAAIHSVAALFCAADDSGQITVYSVSQTRFWLRKAKLDHSATRVVSAVDEPLVASADGRMNCVWDAAYALELAQ